MRCAKLLLFFCVLLLCACAEQRPKHIRVVCTGDVHGHLFPYDHLTGKPLEGSLARVSTFLNELRGQGSVVYIDNGDMLQGTPATYCYNTYAVGKTHIAAEVLNYLQCDAVVMGNNDIEPGGATYQRYMNDLHAPLLGANIEYEGTDTPFATPYTIVEIEGVKIAVLGLTTSAIPYGVPQCQWTELEFEEMERTAQRWVEYLQSHVNPDIIVGLFHSGLEGGFETDKVVANATKRVAERVVGFDAVFYGHDHQARVSEVVNVDGDTVLLLNPGLNAQKVAMLDIVSSSEGAYKLKGLLVSMDDYAPDAAYMEAFATHRERVDKYVGRTIGMSNRMATMEDVLEGPSALVDFMHQMQLDVSSAQISFTAPLVRDAIIPEGIVRVEDIYRLYPYENFLYVLWLTGEEVKNYLEFSYDKWLSLDSHPEMGGYADSAAGIVYKVHADKPKGSRVDILRMADGTTFELDKYYRVALNSYRALGGGGFITEGAGIGYDELAQRVVTMETADLRFQMINYIEMCKEISPQALNQWEFVK